MNNAFDPDAVRDGLIEDQVLLEMPDSPHSQRWEFAGLTRCAKVRHLGKFEEGISGFSEETARRSHATVLADVGKVSDEIAPCGRPYDSSSQVRLGLLPGPHEGKPCVFDMDPIAVRHFRCFPAGLGLFDESIHALLPMRIHRDRLPNAVPKAQKEFGSFLKELFATGELPALNGLIDALLEIGWQGNIYHAVLLAIFYARRLLLFTFDFMIAQVLYGRKPSDELAA
jgi:hypothetical protein